MLRRLQTGFLRDSRSSMIASRRLPDKRRVRMSQLKALDRPPEEDLIRTSPPACLKRGTGIDAAFGLLYIF